MNILTNVYPTLGWKILRNKSIFYFIKKMNFIVIQMKINDELQHFCYKKNVLKRKKQYIY